MNRRLRNLENDNSRMDRRIHEKDEIDMQNQQMKENLEKDRFENDRLSQKIDNEKRAGMDTSDQINRVNADRKHFEFEIDGT